MALSPTSHPPALTAETLAGWEALRSEQARLASEAQARADALTTMIEGGRAYLSGADQIATQADQIATQAGQAVTQAGEAEAPVHISEAVQPSSLVKKIVLALESAEHGPKSPKEIKDKLEKDGLYPDGSSPNYFYSALRRASDRGLIRAKDGKYYVPPSD